MIKRIELWSCGGGRQSSGIAALIKSGKLTPPDHVCMVKLEWEIKTVWPYVETYIKPAIESLDIPFTIIERKDYAMVDMWRESENNNSALMLPVYTNQSGKLSKLPEWCSGEWKRDVVSRWAAEQPGWKERGINVWIGISADEYKRRRKPRKKWIQPTYPLLDKIRMSVQGALRAIKNIGWPEPPRSRCRHCPNQSDREWAELSDEEFEEACQLEDEIRLRDGNAFFHKSLIPLRTVKLDTSTAPPGGFTGGCSAGTCY